MTAIWGGAPIGETVHGKDNARKQQMAENRRGKEQPERLGVMF